MNKHNIEELQAFLQGEYIGEFTSRSLKEVKKHSDLQQTAKNRYDITTLKRIAKTKLSKQNSSTYRFELNINDNSNSDDSYLYKYLSNILNIDDGGRIQIVDKGDYSSKHNNIIKNKLCKLFNFKPDEVGIREDSIMPNRIYFKFVLYEKESKRIPIKNFNQYRFYHYTNHQNLKMLKPTEGSSHARISYGKKSVFFFAVKKSEPKAVNLLMEYLGRFQYGNYCYEYIPKQSDKIFIDMTDVYSDVSIDLNRTRGVFPVIMFTDTPIKVNHIKQYDFDSLKRYKKAGNKTISFRDKIKIRKMSDDADGISNEILTHIEAGVARLESRYVIYSRSKSKDKKSFEELIREIINELKKEYIDDIIKTSKISKEEKNVLYNFYDNTLKDLIKKSKLSNNYKNFILNNKQFYFKTSRQFNESYIDETIERFNAFMEEFNLTHNEDIHNE